MSAADIEGLPSYPTEEGSGRGITLLTSPMSCTLPFVAFRVCDLYIYPPGNSHISPWEKESHLQKVLKSGYFISWRVLYGICRNRVFVLDLVQTS